MSEYLCCGVATRIIIREKIHHSYQNYNIYDEKNNILESINKLIDISLYNVKMIENSIILEIREDIYDDNIHDLIKECAPYMQKVVLIDGKDINLMNFNQNNYSIHIGKYIKEKENEKTKFIENDHGYYYINMNKDNSIYDLSTEYSSLVNSNLLIDHYDKYDSLDIVIDYMRVGVIADYYSKEQTLKLLSILNEFSKSFFKTKLSKSLLFYIC